MANEEVHIKILVLSFKMWWLIVPAAIWWVGYKRGEFVGEHHETEGKHLDASDEIYYNTEDQHVEGPVREVPQTHRDLGMDKDQEVKEHQAHLQLINDINALEDASNADCRANIVPTRVTTQEIPDDTRAPPVTKMLQKNLLKQGPSTGTLEHNAREIRRREGRRAHGPKKSSTLP